MIYSINGKPQNPLKTPQTQDVQNIRQWKLSADWEYILQSSKKLFQREELMLCEWLPSSALLTINSLKLRKKMEELP
jgi:hypothetical protein